MEFRGGDLRATGRVPGARRQVHRAGPEGGDTVARPIALVTGASGYIGRLALDGLVAHGFVVHATSRRPPAPVSGVTWHAADLLASGAPEELIDRTRPELVLHFAWDVTPGAYWTNPLNDAWRDATIALARAHFASGGRRFVGAGTCAEYDWTTGDCHEDTTPLMPASRYGQAKRDAWTGVADAAALATASAAWGRVFYLFGGHEHPSRLVPSVTRALRAGEPALCTHGEQRRDFLHVEDVADAFVALARRDVEGPVNIASGTVHRVREVVEGIAQRLGRPDLLRLGARPMTEPMLIAASVTRLRQEVGWTPRLTFEEALDRAVELGRDGVTA